MGFENQFLNTKKVELYPERTFARADYEIERLKKIESGEIKPIELSETERKELANYENFLGEQLEEIDGLKIDSVAFYPEYFLTNEGRKVFKDSVGIEIEGETVEQIKIFLLTSRAILSKVPGKTLSDLVGKSRLFSEEAIFEALKGTFNENMEADFSSVSNPDRQALILNPEDALKKIDRLRKFKAQIKIQDKNENNNDSLELAKEKIRSLYRKKTNEIIITSAYAAVWASQASELIEDSLTDEEKLLKNMYPGVQKFEKMYSRYDKVLHGASKEYDENGYRKQVGNDLNEYANSLSIKHADNEYIKRAKIKEKGLDVEKLSEKNITQEQFSAWVNEYLEFYGQKSDYPASEFDQKRKGSAPDGKWQFVARDEYEGRMAADQKLRIIRSGTKNKSITGTLATLLGHECTHAVQGFNQSKVPLRLFKKVGGDRAAVFSEGGAKQMEQEVARKLFGYESMSHPYFIAAMQRKLEGGTYLDCVKAFYEGKLKNLLEKKKGGILTEEEFIEKSENWLKESLIKTKRLFHFSDSLDSTNSFLTKSKDTVYAEQILLVEKLKENGLEKYAYIRGFNLDTLAILAEIGMLNLAEIQQPNFEFIENIWQQEKEKYKLAA